MGWPPEQQPRWNGADASRSYGLRAAAAWFALDSARRAWQHSSRGRGGRPLPPGRHSPRPPLLAHYHHPTSQTPTDLTNYDTSPFIIFLQTIPSRFVSRACRGGTRFGCASTPHKPMILLPPPQMPTVPPVHDVCVSADSTAAARVRAHVARGTPVRAPPRALVTVNARNAPTSARLMHTGATLIPHKPTQLSPRGQAGE